MASPTTTTTRKTSAYDKKEVIRASLLAVTMDAAAAKVERYFVAYCFCVCALQTVLVAVGAATSFAAFEDEP